jgi:hypothetical protein
MKLAFTLITVGLLYNSSFASSLHDDLNFKIDWSNPTTLNQSNGIDCQDRDSAKLIIVVPGTYNRDFSAAAAGSDCKLISNQTTKIQDGSISTTLSFLGEGCFPDGDSVYVTQMISGKSTDKVATIGADSGC